MDDRETQDRPVPQNASADPRQQPGPVARQSGSIFSRWTRMFRGREKKNHDDLDIYPLF